MPKPMHVLIAAAALAITPAAHAQQSAEAPKPSMEQVGIWHIGQSAKDCVAMVRNEARDLMVALIYSAPDKHRDAALMLTSKTFFTDARDGAVYPARLVLSQGAQFETRWREVKVTGMVMKDGEYGLRIAAPATDFTDSLAESDGLVLEGIGRGSINLELQDMRPMVDALRKCALAK